MNSTIRDESREGVEWGKGDQGKNGGKGAAASSSAEQLMNITIALPVKKREPVNWINKR